MSDPVNATSLAYKGVKSTPPWVVVAILALALACLVVERRRRNRS
ncbi:hypothetical protein M2271_005006 [Streptomyces sp. LBL]|nr:hypothetical protein [Streptomyces sp. LBL]MDH6627182.1 hypothetical protein [Streptomyces sp. LBL]